ncbi:hypothetical protein [Asticcacaulis sp. EMRT-3]|uniref:hypothetical protein n=1 Tax=Asticcacaulis sp. EMRT-3 TaxID=3040349 RepID=UPI0024AEF837|nr:hypothetical protein [Asticcacaulis sp. EMRT-3]MDI7774603.1 hypothetical protein [Asticcacaulis sp. EMRT-3]
MRIGAVFSLKQALAEAPAFLLKAWGGAWLILLALLAVSLAAPYALKSMPTAAMAGGLFVLLWALKLMALGALYRLAVFGQAARGEGLGFGGVQAGWPELRLLIAQLALLLFLLLIAVTLAMIFLLAFNLSHLGDGYIDTVSAISAIFERHQNFDWAFIIYTVLAVFLLIILSVRLSLMFAASMAQHRIVTLNALGLSEGAAWKLLAGTVIILLPLALTATWILRFRSDIAHPAVVFHTAVCIGAILLILPWFAGFFASSYRQIVANRSK